MMTRTETTAWEVAQLGDNGSDSEPQQGERKRIQPRRLATTPRGAGYGGQSTNASGAVLEPLASGLSVTDGIDPSDGFQPLSSQAMEALGSASDELRDIALANLTDNRNEIQLGEHAHLRRPS